MWLLRVSLRARSRHQFCRVVAVRGSVRDPLSVTELPDDDREYWERVRITLIAIHDEDQAMIPLGSFSLASDLDDPAFHSPRALYRTQQFEILLEMIVCADEDELKLNSLELSVEIHHTAGSARIERWIDDLTKQQVEYLLTYLAGSTRPHTLAAFRDWYDRAVDRQRGVGVRLLGCWSQPREGEFTRK